MPSIYTEVLDYADSFESGRAFFLQEPCDGEESGRNDVMRLLSNMIWVVGFTTNIRLPLLYILKKVRTHPIL